MLSHRQLFFALGLGSGTEVFDYIIFLLFSSYLASAFFPSHNSQLAMLQVLTLFAASYVCRPIGALIFSHFGDRRGRKKLYALTLTLMSSCTLFIALLPGYDVLGPASPCLLIIFRLIQSMAYGAEGSGVATYIIESSIKQRRGYTYGMLNMVNLLVAAFAALLGHEVIHFFSQQEMNKFGWRIPFFIGALLGFIGLYFRRKMSETPLFTNILLKNKRQKLPIKYLLSHHKKTLLVGVSSNSVSAALMAFVLFLPSYLSTYTQQPLRYSFLITATLLILTGILCPLFGRMSDLSGRISTMKKSIMIAPVTFIIIGFSLSPSLLWNSLIVLLLAIPLSMNSTATTVAISELLPTSVRYTGLAFSTSITFGLIGGFFPLIIEYSLQKNLLYLPFYLIFFICLIALFICKKTNISCHENPK